ncbi:ATP-dependent protease La (LON) substrate-binding domain [Carex littledalei]|uniref:ATP-dependent protease La (LON) substrate-binding domain n=1 Tax=Carex littledalei TaxID=544730 RepID=A0A833RRU2_9POAL|nr:ATP-dependent protease La (LON) substrate-binding domain [Carex littledalei]
MFPLYISKSRDRVMMNNVLQTETDHRFGVLFSNPNPTDPSSASVEVEIGCVAEVVNHQILPDDRFFLICKGQPLYIIHDILELPEPLLDGTALALPPLGILKDALDVTNSLAELLDLSRDAQQHAHLILHHFHEKCAKLWQEGIECHHHICFE